MNRLAAHPTRRLLVTLAAVLLAHTAQAQTLARPHWAGSGISSEAWWRNAVFYRIAVPAFQDSDGDGYGDLPGIAQRLDYIQSLGVDAIVLSPGVDANQDQFNALLREASARRIRLVIELGDGQPDLLSTARLWLTRGAAGISIAGSFHTPAEEMQAHLPELRALARTFPGDRVVIARPYGNARLTTPNAAQLTGQIITLPRFVFTPEFASTLLDAPHPAVPTGSTPLLQTGDHIADMLGTETARGIGMQKIIAVILLTTPGAVAFVFGQELGSIGPAGELIGPAMSWTPSNITPPPPLEPEAPPPPSDPAVYGAFKPYVAPRKLPRPPQPGDRPDPNSLPGFTTGHPHMEGHSNQTTANVATEDADPASLLNFYRRLSQLHHGHPALRSGTPTVFNHDSEQAFVWLRRAPSGTRTAGTVIIACNLSPRPISLALNADLSSLHLRPGTLRPLLASWTTAPIAQSTHQLMLPPYSVFIGELFH